ncbi:kinase-like domain-containing protein [Aspergillus filifer]
MLPSFFRSIPRLSFRRKWTPLNFNNPNYGTIHPDQKIEEETVPDYAASRYYPTKIGEVIRNRYQVVSKLGFGITSTVWLARDMEYQEHVTLKISIDNDSSKSTSPWKSHPGHDAIRSLTDYFDIDSHSAQHKHRCFVYPPLFESVWVFLHRNPIGRLPVPVLAVTLKRLFQALDYLHTECRDETAFAQAEEDELQDPSPRKEIDDNRLIYLFRDLSVQPGNVGSPVLVDFGSAVFDDTEHTEDIQPKYYRAPEVILGCIIWDIFQCENFSTGYDPEHEAYRSRAHLADMIKLLGPPPAEFFDETGELRDKFLLKGVTPLEEEDRELFLKFMGKMLRWKPRKRATAGELVNDEWVVKHLS